MRQSNAGGCAIFGGLLLVLILLIPLIEWIAQHAGTVAGILLLIALVVGVATRYSSRLTRERAARRAAASLRVEAARTEIERRLTIAQEFVRLAADALAALPVDAAPQPWSQRLEDLEAAAEQLRLSAGDPLGESLPGSAERTGPDATALRQALDALCDFLHAARAPKPKDWRDEPERLRVLRRERTRLLVAVDAVAARLEL